MTFQELNLHKPLLNALNDLGLDHPTPIQEKVFSVVMSGRDVCAIAQTGTGKTYAYLLPCLRQLQFNKIRVPQVLIVVPTRELVVQVVEAIQQLTPYMSVAVAGVFGGVNMKPQVAELAKGVDIVVGTPGRLADMLHTGTLKTKGIKRLVIDEFDEMLGLGFRAQLQVLFDKLPERRQNLLFSATLAPEAASLLESVLVNHVNIEAEPAGKPLANIDQCYYAVPNFYTKLNCLGYLLRHDASMTKVLVFVATKKMADLVYEELQEMLVDTVDVIHSNKAQQHRFYTVSQFEEGYCRVLIATDVLARGIDVASVTHVINFDLPEAPESYIHRIGRTGRADRSGIAIALVTADEREQLLAIEQLMDYQIPALPLPADVEIADRLLESERTQVAHKIIQIKIPPREVGPAFQEKSEKNTKVNVRRDYEKEKRIKYGKSYRKRSKD